MKEIYLKVCKNYADSCSENITTLMARFNSDLNLFSSITISDEESTSVLIQNMRKLSSYLPDDFINVFFVDSSGYGIEKKGIKVFVGDREYYKKMMVDKKDYYVGNPVVSKTTGIPIFHICKAAYTVQGTRIGFFAVAIPLSSIMANVRENNLLNKTNVFIINSDGNFLQRPHKDVIPLSYSYLDPQSNESLDVLVNSMLKKFKGFYTLRGDKKKKFIIAYTPIEETDWSLGVAVPQKKIDSINNSLRSKMLAVILIFVFLIICFVIIVMGLLFYNRVCEIKEESSGNRDELTGLDTMKKFEKELNNILESDAVQNSNFMFISFDISGLKYINQAYSEQVGDEMLVVFATRLSDFVNSEQGFCAHGYSDHFYAMVPIQNQAIALQKFYSSFYYNQPFEFQHDVVPVLIKSGIVFTGRDYGFNSAQGLIEKAAYARRAIKDNLEDYKIFDEKLHKRLLREKRLEICLPAAFEKNEFYVVYQPKVSIALGLTVGAEALVRWNCGLIGNVPPDDFLPILERNGGIIKLDFFVYEQVFKFLSSRLEKGLPVVPISVNMSRSHVSSNDFLKKFTKIFEKYNVPPSLVEIEILEKSVVKQNQQLVEIIDQLHRIGFKVAMDDFGTGESSLNMLDVIPIDTLKIDRNFLTESGDWERTKQILRKIVELARELKKMVVCEGVETRTQIDFLNSIDCDIVQGFFYSKPLSENDFLDFMEKYT